MVGLYVLDGRGRSDRTGVSRHRGSIPRVIGRPAEVVPGASTSAGDDDGLMDQLEAASDWLTVSIGNVDVASVIGLQLTSMQSSHR